MEKWLITQLFPLFFGAFFITQKLPQVNDCQKTIQYTVETTTTKRDFTQSEKLYTPPMLSDPLSTETDTALLNICVAHGGNCTWEVEGKNKSKLSPVGLYTVSMLRQMAGDWTASPEQFLDDKLKAGGTITTLGKGIVSLRQIDTASGYSSVTMVDKGHCVFLGSSFYNPDNSLKFKIVFKYRTDTEGWQRLESATLSALTMVGDTRKGIFTEITSNFKTR